MQMPGRKYDQAGTASYRYSINGQEKEKELNENITTAEFWEYDSRIGRRWNIDPMPDISFSPYATFGNNPVLNIDPNGDTLSNPQLRDAAKMASSEIMSRIKSDRGFGLKSGDYRRTLSDAIDKYEEKNQLNLGDFADFTQNVESYYNYMAGAAMYSKSEYIKLDRGVINDPGVGDARAIRLTQGYLFEANNGLLSFLNQANAVAVGEAAGAVGTPTGPKPRAPFQSSTGLSTTQRVGQWMSPEEYKMFNKTGEIPRTNVLTRGPAGYEKQANYGDFYVEFDINRTLLRNKSSNGNGWALIKSKNQMEIKLAAKKGQTLAAPIGTNIKMIKSKQ